MLRERTKKALLLVHKLAKEIVPNERCRLADIPRHEI